MKHHTTPDKQTSSPILETRMLTKRFPKVLANDKISIKLRQEEVLSLLGENGAGKSTLMNMLFGLYAPTSGDIFINGEKVTFHSPKYAITHGLGMVHQHFMLIDTLSVTENIILGQEPGSYGLINYRKAHEEVANISSQYGLEIDPTAIIENLSVGQQQRVEILKALYRKVKILILDEPTAVLTPQETVELFKVIRRLRDGGVSVIIITHKLEEVMSIADRVYVLRRGQVVGEANIADVTKKKLANMMVGREVVLQITRTAHKIIDKPIFSIRNLVLKDNRDYTAINNLSLDVRPGEIAGIAGVDGNGQRELAQAIMGLRTAASGSITYDGEEISPLSTKERIARAISYVPPDRQKSGVVLPMKVSENAIIGYHWDTQFSRHGRLLHKERIKFAQTLQEKYDIRTPSVEVPVSNLSGGNQQKVIVAREFSRNPKFLLISQPTRGLDVGAIEYVHQQIIKMRDEQVAILLISLELEEIFSLSDRILVLFEGQIVHETTPDTSSDQEVGIHMTGGTVHGTAQ